MLVSPVEYNVHELDENARFYLIGKEPINITSDQVYTVYGLFTQTNTVYILIINSFGVPQWLPAAIFKVVDNAVNDDWVIDIFEGGKEIIIGPSYLAKDTNYFTLLAERDSRTVKDFIDRQAH